MDDDGVRCKACESEAETGEPHEWTMGLLGAGQEGDA